MGESGLCYCLILYIIMGMSFGMRYSLFRSCGAASSDLSGYVITA